MPNQLAISSHCVVQWEDIKEEYAIVDTKRSKAVSILKVGLTTLFEGYNRERRRGKILFMGTKKDCFSYGFDVVEDDAQLNTYSWSSPPGLREQSEEVAQTIRNGSLSSFQRTASSSSTNSVASVTKSKLKKLKNKNLNDIDEPTIVDDQQSMLPPPLTSTCILAEKRNCTNKDVVHDQPSNSNDRPSNSNDQPSLSSSNSNSVVSKTKTHGPPDVDSLLAEIKTLREKNLLLQEELLYQREISVGLPNEEAYNYLKSLCFKHEQTKSEHNQKAIELGKKLPCTCVELKLAKKTNVSATINNLIKCCFKNIDLKSLCFEKLEKINKELLEQIFEYVKHIHAPAVILKSAFSSAISLKCRHLREGDKNKNGASAAQKHKQKRNRKHSSDNRVNGNQQTAEASNELSIEDMDEDKENAF